MRVEEAAVNVERSGEFKESTFRIKASRKAFDILSSQIYTDIPLAVVRELSTNAWDAHVDAGTTDRPFSVHLPNNLEPHFSIRDYGTGLSPGDIETLYTTYFESNKTHSNDFTGCLGIGSKSPFAYTDSFQVISFFNGKKYTYNCFKGEEGFPKVALMDVQDTDEHNGLEIIIAIKKGDFNTFAYKAQKLYRYFPLQPDVIGNKEAYNAEPETPLYEGTCWKLMGKNRDRSVAVMGNVAYPLNRYSLADDVRDIPYNNEFIIQFKIGELEMAANREELQWNEKTINAINEKLKIVKKELVDQVQSTFNKCTTLWAARVMAHEIMDYGGALYNLRNIFQNGKSLQWQGHTLETSVKTRDLSSNGVNICMLKLKHQRSRIICTKEDRVDSIGVSNKVVFMVNDLSRAGLARTRSWMKETISTDKYVYFIEFENSQALSYFHQKLGTDKSNLKFASSLPKVQYKRFAPGAVKTTVTMFAWRQGPNYYGNPEDWWEECEVDPTVEYGCYVPIKRFKIGTGDNYQNREPSTLKPILASLEKIGAKPDIVYGIKAGYANKTTAKHSGWVSFYDYAREKLEEYIKKNNLQQDIVNYKGVVKMERTSDYMTIYRELGSTVDGSIFDKLCKAIKMAKGLATDELQHALELGQTIGYDFEGATTLVDLKLENQIESRYPLLLPLVRDSYAFRLTNDNVKKLANYIKMIEGEGS